uniref:Uncharacterized protein n=1 Tax=Poecilia latipinna TaxID=48699 RepID=A0A3B3TSI8_9TELE
VCVCVCQAADKGKVVCAKFPPQAVDEASLRKLIEPFGKVGKVLMFPSLVRLHLSLSHTHTHTHTHTPPQPRWGPNHLCAPQAFVEMGSSDQAKDLVKFYSSSDPEARKVNVEFNISNVVSFTPAPSGEDGRSDLLSIAKRFGEPLYTLFLPSKAFVEMKLSAEAQKLVDYYSASALRINGATIQVTRFQKVLETQRVKTPQMKTRSRKSSGDDGTRTGSDEELDQPKTASRTAPEPGPEKRKATPENNGVPLKTLRTENGPEPGQNQDTAEPKADEEEKQQIKTDEQNPAEPEPLEQVGLPSRSGL